MTEEELSGSNLSSNMDLVNPASEEMEANLKALGFPTGDDVEGETELSFDISQFMPMLASLGNGETDFVLTLTDNADGVVTKTLMLNVVSAN